MPQYTRVQLSDRVVWRMIVPAVVSQTSETQAEGKLDCGADRTAVPKTLLQLINARPSGVVNISGALDERPKEVATYFVNISVDGLQFDDIEVIETPNKYVLVGLDLLNECGLKANGPAKSFELTRPSSA